MAAAAMATSVASVWSVDGAVVDALLDQIADPIASFTADGDYDQDRVSQAVAKRHPNAAVIVPPRAGAVESASAETAPTQRDRHLRMTAERGRMAWQKASGYNVRAKVETSIGRYKRVIGDALRSRPMSFLVTSSATISPLSASTPISSFRSDRRRDVRCF